MTGSAISISAGQVPGLVSRLNLFTLEQRV